MKIEWLILADAAQIQGGKLYVLGGGWDRLEVNSDFPVHQRVAIAASFLIDWNETNEKHPVTLEVMTADGVRLAKVDGAVEAGRPPGRPAGQPQRAQLAVEMGMQFEAAGTYEIVARADGEVTKIYFNVVPGPFLLARQQPGRGAA